MTNTVNLYDLIIAVGIILFFVLPAGLVLRDVYVSLVPKRKKKNSTHGTLVRLSDYKQRKNLK